MQKPGFVQDNQTHKILWDSKIQTDQSIPAKMLDLVLIIKKKIFN